MPRRMLLYTREGVEVTVKFTCLRCGHVKDLAEFGLRRQPKGGRRNLNVCATCRGGWRKPKPPRDERAQEEFELERV